MIEYQYSVDQKLHIMKGIFHNMECGIKIGELDGSHMLANPFLSAVIFELAIKSMWELSHSKVFGRTEIDQYRHYIDRVYPCLREDFCEFIRNKYNAEVTYFRNTLQEILNSYQCRNLPEGDRVSILSCSYFSLKECLKENSKIVTNGKYEFQQGRKINVITGIIPKSDLSNDPVDCYRQPSPFLKEIMNYIQTQLDSLDPVKNLLWNSI
ncbi:MAG: hypothetical protein OXU51_24235 [Candidatus Poribacteria bacterium]|nr:hypothetical protein [Candidatus Poribacteria bacterium]